MLIKDIIIYIWEYIFLYFSAFLEDPVTMNTLSGKFGNFIVDCLAIYANAICSKFYSRYSSTGISGVNFFAQILSQEDYYVFLLLEKLLMPFFILKLSKYLGFWSFLFGQDPRYFLDSFQKVFMHPHGC